MVVLVGRQHTRLLRALTLAAVAVAAAVLFARTPADGRGGGKDGDDEAFASRCVHNVAFHESHPKCAELEARAQAGETHEKYWLSPAPPPPAPAAPGAARCKHNIAFIATHPRCAYLEAVALEQQAAAALGFGDDDDDEV